jgi:O-antigen/teichoic acid export membrane protein
LRIPHTPEGHGKASGVTHGIGGTRRSVSLFLAILHNFGSAMGAKVAGLLLGVVTYSVLARTLGTAGLGRYRTVLTLLLFAGVLFDYGLYSITLRDISQPDADPARILGNSVALRIAATSCAIVLLVLGLSAAGAGAASGVMIAGIGWVALQVSELLRAIFQLKLAQPRAALAEIAGAIATLLLVVAIASVHGGTDSMLAATAAGFCCTAIVSWRFASRLLPLRPRFEWHVWRGFLVAGLPIAGSLILQTIQLRVDVLFLALLRSPAELGLYDAPLKLYELLFAVPYLFGGLMLPLYVRDAGDRADSVAPRLNAALSASFIFSTLTFAILVECAGPIVVLFAGPSFMGSADPLRILAASAIFVGVTGTLRFAAVATHQQGRILRADIIGVCAAISAHAILIPRYGIVGAAVGKLCGDVVTAVSASIIMRRLLSRTIVLTAFVSATAAGCLIAAVAFAVNVDVPWFVASGVFAPVILAGILLVPRVRRTLAPLGASSSAHP